MDLKTLYLFLVRVSQTIKLFSHIQDLFCHVLLRCLERMSDSSPVALSEHLASSARERGYKSLWTETRPDSSLYALLEPWQLLPSFGSPQAVWGPRSNNARLLQSERGLRQQLFSPRREIQLLEYLKPSNCFLTFRNYISFYLIWTFFICSL